jgi:hypothetical protein
VHLATRDGRRGECCSWRRSTARTDGQADTPSQGAVWRLWERLELPLCYPSDGYAIRIHFRTAVSGHYRDIEHVTNSQVVARNGAAVRSSFDTTRRRRRLDRSGGGWHPYPVVSDVPGELYSYAAVKHFVAIPAG